MCYKEDLETDFYWRSIEDEEKPLWDHTYLVSDGEVIGLCGFSFENGEDIWEYIEGNKIRTTTYYGGDMGEGMGNIASKLYIKIENIKYWCPIPSQKNKEV